MINPNNVPPVLDKQSGEGYFSKEIAGNFPYAMKVLGLISIILGMAAAYFITENEEAKKMKYTEGLCKSLIDKNTPSRIQVLEDAKEQTTVSILDIYGSSLRRPYCETILRKGNLENKIIKTYSMRHLMTITFSVFLYINYTENIYKYMGYQLKYSDKFLANLGAIIFVFNALSKLLAGIFAQYLPIKRTLIAIISLQVIGNFAMPFVAGNQTLFFLNVGIINEFCSGCFQTYLFTLPSKIFGNQLGKHYSSIVLLCYLLTYIVGGIL